MDYIIDNGADSKYLFEIPNIVDDMNLSVYAYRLYGHLKRVTSSNCLCDQSTTILAECCNMSVGSITNAKQELLAKNLITIENKPSERGKNYHLIGCRL